ncbi:Serine proteinase inhibitor IA-2 [Penicillium digitatum]|uniref:Serine proteinase inhibitor IA-2 n=1 Tax=Penicillium digitatum TaxID=36651 RepID=A0A7T7BN16_PENDI|nr:Serine proteinase inhibitor IA-2 [Penicillium digitatum]
MAPKYIVTFQDSAATEKINSYTHQIHQEGGSVTNRFPDMIARGFSAFITDSVLRRLESDCCVAHITPDTS